MSLMSLSYLTSPLKTWSLIVPEAESFAMTGFSLPGVADGAFDEAVGVPLDLLAAGGREKEQEKYVNEESFHRDHEDTD